MKWTNEMIKQIAMQQSALDANCSVKDFICDKNMVIVSKENELARKYLKLPHVCNLISYGDNIVATISEKYRDIVEQYINKYPVEHCFETPNMHVLNDAFQGLGFRVCFMAACSADCETMWQIGVDVLPEYRRKGIASALTSRLAMEILERDKVPFYCCAWSNLKSARNAIKSGFRPAWVEMTVKSASTVDEMNM